MISFDLVIFDCDGTLVDSEWLCNFSTSEVLTAAGHPQYTPEYCLSTFIGAGQSMIWRTVAKESGQPLPANINQQFIDRVAANVDAMAKAAPGIEDVLSALSQNHKICVGSNGERPNVVGALKATGLLPFFSDDRIFTVEDVVHPKPAPDLYLHAAKQMGVAPDRCLVVEDSVAGATAGVAAGMKVFGYHGLAHDQVSQADKLKNIGVHIVSPDLKDLLSFIE
jgi:HAD superfamily hydrolase (TIGR01509 family)